MEHLRAGTLRVLAVTAGRRIDLLPDVPMMQEAGVLSYDFASWNAVWMPARSPASVVARLDREIVAIGESVEAKRFTAQELARCARIVAEAGIARE